MNSPFTSPLVVPGDQWQEAVLLRLAEALEQQLPRRTPPSFVDFLGKDWAPGRTGRAQRLVKKNHVENRRKNHETLKRCVFFIFFWGPKLVKLVRKTKVKHSLYGWCYICFPMIFGDSANKFRNPVRRCFVLKSCHRMVKPLRWWFCAAQGGKSSLSTVVADFSSSIDGYCKHLNHLVRARSQTWTDRNW